MGRRYGETIPVRLTLGMIEAIDDLSIDAIVNVQEIADHSGRGVHLTANCHFYAVIVTVTMRVVAFPVRGLVLGEAQSVTMQTMRGREHVASCQVRLHYSSP